MIVTVVYTGDTRNYVKYESADMDFSHSGVKIKAWIPKEEIMTNIPGVFPQEIGLRIMDDSSGEDDGRS